MEIDIYKKGSYHVFRMREDVGINTDLSELKQRIQKSLLEGTRNVALAFTKDSYLYTKSIATLIACSEMIKDYGGKLAIIEANRDILDILSVIDFDRLIKIVATENDLLSEPVAPAGIKPA
jgi:anti-anti-sigma regulatory factor